MEVKIGKEDENERKRKWKKNERKSRWSGVLDVFVGMFVLRIPEPSASAGVNA